MFPKGDQTQLKQVLSMKSEHLSFILKIFRKIAARSRQVRIQIIQIYEA